MSDIDKVSLAIGELIGKVDGMEKKLSAACTDIKNINITLTNHRIKTAGKAGGISVVVSFIINVIIAYFNPFKR